MSFGKDTALARAERVRATFPTGKITVKQAKAMFLAVIDSQVGYYTGNSKLSLYGNGQRWATEGDWNWQGYWCARGLSWAFDYCFGAQAAIAGIGKQPYTPMPAGWAATWHWRNWFRDNGRWVGIENAQPGDIMLQSWGRTANETDHVEAVTGYWDGTDLPGTGFNTSSGIGSETTGAGVYRVRRKRWPIVGVYRPDWEKLVATYNMGVLVDKAAEIVDQLTEYADALLDLGYTADEAGVREAQADLGLTVDGILGPKTAAALEEAMSEVRETLTALQAQIAELQKQVAATPSTGDVVKALMSYDLYGWPVHWWLRQGSLGQQFEHPNYPADPGSPADYQRRAAESQLGEAIPPYREGMKRSDQESDK